MSLVVVVRGQDATEVVEEGLSYFEEPEARKVILKPNLIIDRPGPTTPVDIVEALVEHYGPGHEVV
ncbi:hypothetical protein DRO32_05080, partial [Candidatus Bathyarchaeota archaeon]